jgi:hypothetical protein
MTVLLSEEADELREIQTICGRLRVDVVAIGAVAYRTWVQDEQALPKTWPWLLGSTCRISAS